MSFPVLFSGQRGRRRRLLTTAGLAPEMVLARPSGAWSISSAGRLAQVGSNTPRIAFDETATDNAALGASNAIRNPRGEGCGTGTAPPNNTSVVTALLPTFWSCANHSSGLSVDVSPTTYKGMSGVRLRYYGTVTGPSGSASSIEFDSRTAISCAANQTRAHSFYYRLAAGTWPAGATFNTRTIAGNNSPSFSLVMNTAEPQNIPTADLQRAERTPTMSPALTTSPTVIHGAHVTNWTPGATVDFTIELFYPQSEVATAVSPGPILPPPGVLGASTETLVVNYIGNPRAETTAQDSFPDGWAGVVTTSAGVPVSVAGRGDESGWPYVDLLFQGTPTSTTEIRIGLTSATNGAPVVSNDPVVFAAHVRRIAGTSLRARPIVRMRDASAQLVGNIFGPDFDLGKPSLAEARGAAVGAATGPGVAWAVPEISLMVNKDEPVYQILRVGGPGLFKLAADPGFTPLPPVGQPSVSGNLKRLGPLLEEQRSNLSASVPSVVPDGWANPGTTVITPDGYTASKLSFRDQFFGFYDNSGAAWLTPIGGVSGGANPYPRPLRLDGWERQTLSVVTPPSCNSLRPYISRAPSGSPSSYRNYAVLGGRTYTFSFYAMLDPDGISMQIREVQLEEGAFASTPIVNATVDPVTRAADALLLPQAGLPRDLLNGGFVLRWLDLAPTVQPATRNVFLISSGGTANRLFHAYVSGNDNQVEARITRAGVNSFSGKVGVLNPGGWNTYAATWGRNGRAAHCLNGGPVLATRTAVLPDFSALTDGLRILSGPIAGGNSFPAIVSRSDLFSGRVLSDGELRSITGAS